MAERKGLVALAAGAVAAGAGFAAQRAALNRRRRTDPERDEDFGGRRGERSRMFQLPDGARIFVEEVGPEGATRGAIFIHGSVLRTDVWHYQMEGLGGQRLAFSDLRGHGLSQPKGEAAYSLKTLSDDLLATIDELGLQETVVVGHSIGGMIALQLCK
ncbi:MAG: alpha/beta fold hydrolase, partial [Actinomycetota bacterium]